MNEEKIECVECLKCGRLHKMEEKTYMKILGVIYIGQDHGLIGVDPKIAHWCLTSPKASIGKVRSCFEDWLRDGKEI